MQRYRQHFGLRWVGNAHKKRQKYFYFLYFLSNFLTESRDLCRVWISPQPLDGAARDVIKEKIIVLGEL